MSKEYIISGDDAIDCLELLLDNIKKSTMYRIKTGFNLKTASSVFKYDSTSKPSKLRAMRIEIGIRNLVDNSRGDFVCSQDLVDCVRMVFHEQRHLQQHTIIYKNVSADRYIQEMAMFQSVCNGFPEFSRHCEFRNPSEVDAEIYGWGQAVKYFDTHFLDDNSNPLIDACLELVDKVKQDYQHDYGWYGDLRAVNSYASAMSSLEKSRYFYKNQYFSFLKDNKTAIVSNNLNNFIKNEIYKMAFYNAKTPMDSMQVLYEYLVNTSQVSLAHYPCLKSSIDEIKSGNCIVNLNHNKLSSDFRSSHSKNDKQRSVSRGEQAELVFGNITEKAKEKQSDIDYSG